MGVALLPSAPYYRTFFDAVVEPWLHPCPTFARPRLAQVTVIPCPSRPAEFLTERYPQKRMLLKTVQAQEEEAR